MARIRAITTFLGIPTALPTWILGAGGVLSLVAVALGLPRTRTMKAVRADASRSHAQPG